MSELSSQMNTFVEFKIMTGGSYSNVAEAGRRISQPKTCIKRSELLFYGCCNNAE